MSAKITTLEQLLHVLNEFYDHAGSQNTELSRYAHPQAHITTTANTNTRPQTGFLLSTGRRRWRGSTATRFSRTQR